MKFNDYNIHQRFSIRKYSFGACSVLLGLALLGVSQNVNADELSVSNSDTSVVASTGVTGSSEATSTDNTSEKATTDTTSTDNTSEKSTTDTTSNVRSEVSASSPNISVSASVADKTTEGYTVTVDQVTEKDNSVVSGDAITNTITLTTTEPHTLSADAYIKQTVTVDGTHTALKPTTIGLTDGSNNGEAQSTSGDEVSVLKLSTGAISSGSVRQFSSNVRLDSLATGQNITVLYELYDKGVLLASKSLEYAVENKKSDYSTNKTSNEFLTKFNTDETVKSTQPLHVGIYQNTEGITYQYGEITGTLPDGMTLTSDAISKGWTQNGNTITRKFIQSDVSSTFVKPAGWENAGNNDLSYQGVGSSSLSLDTSKYGTYSELRDGKAYTIPFSVKLYSETGSSYTTDTSVSGTLRTSDKGIASGTGAGSALFTSNNKTEYKDNVLNPSSVQVSFTQGASQDTLNSGGSFSFADGIEYHLDANNAIKDYSVELVRASANKASSPSELDKISFDVYSLDTNEKLGSFKFSSGYYGFFAAEKNAIKIPDNTKGIKFVPTGDVTEFSTSTIQSLGAIFKITPTNQKQLKSDYESNGDTLISKFTSNVVGASGVEANLQYDKVSSVVSTGLYYTAGQLTSSGKNFGVQQMKLLISNTEDNSPINTTISKLTNDTANLVLTVPDALTVKLNGKEYTNGTFTIPMNTLKYVGFDAALRNRISYEVVANADSADGRYELSWAFEWSKASDEIKSLVSGVSPLADNVESTSYNVPYTIVNLLQLGSQTTVANKSGAFTSSKDDVEKDIDFKIKQTVFNTLKNSLNNVQSISYLPTKGFEGSTYDVRLTNSVTVPTNWKVVYTTDAITGDRASDINNLTWSDSVSDYSKVTAVKYVQTTGSFGSNEFVSFELPVKTTDTLKVDDVAKMDIAITSSTLGTIVKSNPANMKPLTYTEKWVTEDSTELTDSVKTTDKPSLTTTKTFTDYDHLSDNDEGRIVTHVYKLQDKADVTVVHKLSDGTVLSTKKVIDQGKVGTDYTTTAEVPDTTTVVTEDGSDLVTTVTTYTTTTPENANGKVVLGGTTVTYIYTPNPVSTRTPKEKKVSEAPIPSTMKYVADPSLEYNKQVVDVPNTDGKTITVEVSKIVDGKIVTTTETRTETDKVDGTTRVGNVKTDNTDIAKSTVYKANGQAVGTNTRITEGSDGVSTTVTTYDVNPNTGALENGKPITTTTKEKVDTVEGIGNVKTDNTNINFATVYRANGQSVGTNARITEGTNGVSTTVTTYDVNPNTGALENGKPVTTTTKEKVDTVEGIGNVKTETTDINFATKYQPSGELVGQPNKTVTDGTNGVSTTVTTYDVNPTTGALENGKPVTTTVDAKDKVVAVADVKVTNTDIEFETVYEYDATLEPNTVKEVQAGVKGVSTKTDTYNVNSTTGELTDIASTKTDVKDPVKRIVKYNNIVTTTEEVPNTTKYQPSGDKIGTDSKVITEGNKVSKEITTTYEFDKTTGTLVNPKVTEKVITPSVDKVVAVPNVETKDTVSEIEKVYQKNGKEVGTPDETITKGVSKIVTTTTTYKVDENTGKLSDPTSVDTVTTEGVKEVIGVANVKTVSTVVKYKTITRINPNLAEGETRVVQKGQNGEKVLVTTWEVDPKTGELINPKTDEVGLEGVDEIIEIGVAKLTKPNQPTQPTTPTPQPTSKVSESVPAPMSRVAKYHELPNTGTDSSIAVGILGSMLTVLGLASTGLKRKKE